MVDEFKEVKVEENYACDNLDRKSNLEEVEKYESTLTDMDKTVSEVNSHDDQCKCVCGMGCLHDLSPFEIRHLEDEVIDQYKTKSKCQSKCDVCRKMERFFNILFNNKN